MNVGVLDEDVLGVVLEVRLVLVKVEEGGVDEAEELGELGGPCARRAWM